MTVAEMIVALSRLPAQARVVLGNDWGDVALGYGYLPLSSAHGGPTVTLTNTPEVKARFLA